MNTPVPAGLTSYPTVSGQRYRLYGHARNVPVPSSGDDPARTALVAAGFQNLIFYADRTSLPADWPNTSVPSTSADERPFYADGVWSISSPLPTSITVGSGFLIIYSVWQYMPDSSVTPTPPSGLQNTTLSTTTTSTSNVGLYAAVGLLAAGLGFLVVSMSKRGTHAVANPYNDLDETTYTEMYGKTPIWLNWVRSTNTWRARTRNVPGYFEAAKYDEALNKMIEYLKTFKTEAIENPVHYSTSFVYRDVNVHIHEIDYGDPKYCADYSAIDQFVPGTGGQICAPKQNMAITGAKKQIDAILARAAATQPRYARPVERSPFLSPWDNES